MISNRVSNDLRLVEDFSGMLFLNDPRLAEDGPNLKIKVESLNVQAIAVFMLFAVLVLAFLAFCFGTDPNYTALLLGGGALAGSVFVGAMYLIASSHRDQILPYIERETGSLVLVSGTTIPKCDVLAFRQYQCQTKMSNFKLVLTTVEARGASGTREYGVVPVTGKFTQDHVGKAMADFLDVPLEQDVNRKFTAQSLSKLGLT